MKLTLRILLVLAVLLAGMDLGIYLWPDYNTNDPGPPHSWRFVTEHRMNMIAPGSCPPEPCMTVSDLGTVLRK